jgi:hypothetical protein
VSVLDHFRHPGWPRRALFGLGLLLALTVIIRLVLDPIAAHFTHKQLNASEAASGDFESVHVTLLPPKPSSTERAPRTGKLRVAPTGEQPKGTPLAQAPEGLLMPGAEQKIHDKLSAGGFMKEDANASTGAALRRFQAAHDLPSTGVPDHETVRRLGLNPDDLFRKAAP